MSPPQGGPLGVHAATAEPLGHIGPAGLPDHDHWAPRQTRLPTGTPLPGPARAVWANFPQETQSGPARGHRPPRPG
eukprot:11184181-Lingulodinium_polyedra.AAC.1